MPIVKATIEGREYSFASLLTEEVEQLMKLGRPPENFFDGVRFWTPFIKSSMERASCEMPDIGKMDFDVSQRVVPEFVRNVTKASELTGQGDIPGEAQPVVTTGTTS